MEHIWAVCPAVDGADSLQSGTKYGIGNKKRSGYSEGRNGCRRSGRSN